MKHKVEVLITESDIKQRVNEIADEVSEFFKGEEVTMVCILKGGVMFMVDLARAIRFNVEIDFMDVKSYGNSMKSSGKVEIRKDLTDSIEGKNIVVVEDIIDSGRTLHYILQILESRNPKCLKVCTLLDKPQARVVETQVDWVGFSIPDEFVVGYGLDFEQQYRNLNYIGVVVLEDE